MTARPYRAVLVLLAATVAFLALGIGPASARVTVTSTAAAGGSGEITFHVPDASTATTTSLRVQLPTDKPLMSVTVRSTPGWTAALSTAPLNPPVVDADGNRVTEAVTGILWTADPGPGIKPGEYQTFSFTAGPLPHVESLSFPTIQGYDDGSEIGWIQPTVAGQDQVQRPAPVLKLNGNGAGTGLSPADSATATGSTSRTTVSTLVLAIVGALAGLAALALTLASRWEQRDKTSG